MPEKSKKLILIDGNAIIHRAYHALPPLTNKKGELLNAVYGFTSTLLSVIDKFKPEYVLATFDLAEPTFRHKEYKEYKATRVKADQALYDQIPRVKEVVRTMGIPIFEKAGFEADDLIGTIAKQSEENKLNGEIENIIVTGDLDTLQLVSPKTKVYTMRRGLTDSVMYGEKEILERYGLRPDQLIDFKGLRGDPSDNIPGVKGIGEKTACELLVNYGTLEDVYKNIDKIKGATKEKLERDKMQAIQSKKLATIERKVPVELKLEEARIQDFDRQKLVKLFQELNFFSLIKRLPGSDAKDTNLHANAAKKVGGVRDMKYDYISEDKIEAFLEMLRQQKEIAFAFKTSPQPSPYKGEGEIQGLAFSWKTGRAGYIAFGEFKIQNSKFKIIFEDNKITKIGYDVKQSVKYLGKLDIKIQKFEDVMLEAYVLNPGGKGELSTLVISELGEEMLEEPKKGQLGLNIDTNEEIAKRYCSRAGYIFKLNQIYSERIKTLSQEQKKKNNISSVYRDIEIPLVEILAQMEETGIKLNTVIFKGISEKINARIKNLEMSIYKLSGTEFNINSSRQLAEILFEKLKLPTADIKKGKTGYSTASNELGKLRSKHKIIEKIEEYREIFKLKTTYLDTLPEIVDKNSRIHTTFNQAVTATGRLSSSEPNLQNIPIRTDLGQLLRVAFEAQKGWRLVSADYSQIDLRAVAHVSQDKKLIELFRQGADIHRATAAEINKVTLSKVTEKMRSAAKALNFGIIYGMSAFGFSQSAGIEREEAKKFIDAYFEKFTGVAQYMRSTKESAKIKGYVETEMGRRRNIPEINSSNFMVANAAERMAINMPIQGMSADIVKLAMIKVFEKYKNNPDIRMLLQVHDEIIWEVKEGIAEKVGQEIKKIMESVYPMKVPLVVDIKIGDNWGEI
jgi:DNA polymerase-1